MTLISAISISLILVVYFLDQSGYQFPYLDFLCSSQTPDFLPTEESTKGLAPIAGTNADTNRTDVFKSSNINSNILQEQQEQPHQKVQVNATPVNNSLQQLADFVSSEYFVQSFEEEEEEDEDKENKKVSLSEEEVDSEGCVATIAVNI